MMVKSWFFPDVPSFSPFFSWFFLDQKLPKKVLRDLGLSSGQAWGAKHALSRCDYGVVRKKNIGMWGWVKTY